MAYIDRLLKLKKIVVCSCYYGCPFEFNAPPTYGHREDLEAQEIMNGHFAHVRLDGLRFAGLYRWPGPVHERRGHYQVVIDERTTERSARHCSPSAAARSRNRRRRSRRMPAMTRAKDHVCQPAMSTTRSDPNGCD